MEKKPKKQDNTPNEGIGISLGLCFGTVIGIAVKQLVIGIVLGLCFGVVLDYYLRKKKQ